MKHLLSCLVCVFAGAAVSLCLGQGKVGFNNSSTSLVQWVSPSDGSLQVVPKGQAYVQLFYAPPNTPYTPYHYNGAAFISQNTGWTLGSVTQISPVAGRFDGGIVTLTGIAAGAMADYVIIGWGGPIASFDEAVNSGAPSGVSQKFTTPTGGVDPLIPPPSLSGTIESFVIGLPEPSFFSLATLGAFLIFFRRRRNPKNEQIT